MNIYEKLGEYEPFNFLGVNFMTDQAFKKTLCAGIEGRTKNRATDIKEAIYSLKRAIVAVENGDLYTGKASNISSLEIAACLSKYQSVYNTNIHQLNAARMILFFMKNSNSAYLKDAIVCLSSL